MLARQGLDCRRDGFVLPQRLEDNVAPGVVLGFFRGDHTLFLHQVHYTLILGQQREIAGSELIRSTVTNLRDGHHPMPNVYRC
jgi:hypothetical protein